MARNVFWPDVHPKRRGRIHVFFGALDDHSCMHYSPTWHGGDLQGKILPWNVEMLGVRLGMLWQISGLSHCDGRIHEAERGPGVFREVSTSSGSRFRST